MDQSDDAAKQLIRITYSINGSNAVEKSPTSHRNRLSVVSILQV